MVNMGNGLFGLQSSTPGDHSVWILDFGLCRKVAISLKGVERVIPAFWGNDPYSPRPGKENAVCNEFRERYILISDACLDFCGSQEAQGDHKLLRQFIDLLEREWNEKTNN
jgi:Zinc finger protein.